MIQNNAVPAAFKVNPSSTFEMSFQSTLTHSENGILWNL